MCEPADDDGRACQRPGACARRRAGARFRTSAPIVAQHRSDDLRPHDGAADRVTESVLGGGSALREQIVFLVLRSPLTASISTSLCRRQFLVGASACATVALAGCTTAPLEITTPAAPAVDLSFVTMYGAMPEEQFPIPAVDLSKVDSKYYRRLVDDPTGEIPGTLVVDTRSFYLYLVRPGGRGGLALRRRSGARRLRVVGSRTHPVEAGLAQMDASGRDDRSSTGTREVERRKWWAAAGSRQPARRPCALHLPGRRRHTLPTARNARILDDREGRFKRLRSTDESGHHRPLRPGAKSNADRRAVGEVQMPVNPLASQVARGLTTLAHTMEQS